MISWFRAERNDGVMSGLVDAVRTLNKSDGRNWREGILFYHRGHNGGVQLNPQDSQLRVKARADMLLYLVLDAQQPCHKQLQQFVQVSVRLRPASAKPTQTLNLRICN